MTLKLLKLRKKITDHNQDEYITNSEFNKLTAENLTVRLKQANSVTKIDFYDKLKSLNQKINSNKKNKNIYLLN